MTNPGDKPKEISGSDAEKLVPLSPEKTPTEIRQERLTQINQELSDFNYQPTSPEDIQQIKGQREQEYQSQLAELETGLGTGLSEKSKEMIHKNMIDSAIEQAQKENERFDLLHIQKMILENIDNIDFRKKISPTQSEYLTEETFEKALKQLIMASIKLPEADRIRLFRKTLEYYSTSSQVEKPLWHSTGSYSLRKGLEEGLEGGHSDEAGEGSINRKEGDEKQPHLSISYANAIPAETFQQIFARQSVGNKFDNNLKIDSVAITGQDLPQQFLDELFSSSSEDEMKQLAIEQVNAIIDKKLH